ncbi:hypothetical protein [Cognatishimia sp.]|uniref:hypothetical protein n=1 Tax=Cognatishimia sp. TaxID=2211648 RepID=UPI003519D71D|nr:hypothetical protein [Cognatishimia sp.]
MVQDKKWAIKKMLEGKIVIDKDGYLVRYYNGNFEMLKPPINESSWVGVSINNFFEPDWALYLGKDDFLDSIKIEEFRDSVNDKRFGSVDYERKLLEFCTQTAHKVNELLKYIKQKEKQK